MVFIDADAFIGLHVASDAHHDRARKIMADIKDEIITSIEVVDEVATKLSLFTTRNKAVDFVNEILASKIRIEYVVSARIEKIAKLFARQKSKQVSFTDCANIIICRNLGIKRVFSFDKHYQQNGLESLD